MYVVLIHNHNKLVDGDGAVICLLGIEETAEDTRIIVERFE
jgi:hypothetical protein